MTASSCNWISALLTFWETGEASECDLTNLSALRFFTLCSCCVNTWFGSTNTVQAHTLPASVPQPQYISMMFLCPGKLAGNLQVTWSQVLPGQNHRVRPGRWSDESGPRASVGPGPPPPVLCPVASGVWRHTYSNHSGQGLSICCVLCLPHFILEAGAIVIVIPASSYAGGN